MVTENRRLAEVTEAAERMGTIPPHSRERLNTSTTEGTEFHKRQNTEACRGTPFSVAFLREPQRPLW